MRESFFFLYFIYATSICSMYFELQMRSVEFKRGFLRYFCTKLHRPYRRVSPLPISFSLSAALILNLSFFLLFLESFSFFSSLPFRLNLCTRPCDAITLPISSSRDHLLFRPFLGRSVVIETGKRPLSVEFLHS